MDDLARRVHSRYWVPLRKTPEEREQINRLWGSDDDDSSDDGQRKAAEAIVHAQAHKWLGKTATGSVG